MKISKLTLPIDQVLWQNKTWSIELLAGRKELAVTNGRSVAYAYFDRTNDLLRWDRLIVPTYVRKEALKQAYKSGMISIYSDNI